MDAATEAKEITAALRSNGRNELWVGDYLNWYQAQFGSWALRELLLPQLRSIPELHMTKSNAGLWMGRAKKLKKYFPNPTIYNQLLLQASGHNIIVREKKAGETGHYVLSSYVENAMEKHVLGSPPTGNDKNKAADYVRKLLRVSGRLRAKARMRT